MNIPTENGSPSRVAVDGVTGLIYVAVPNKGEILVFGQDGTFIDSMGGFKRPVSVAIDGSGKVYVGDLKDKSVTVSGSDGQYLFSLGGGTGEFGMPGDIATAKNGSVYVTDSMNNTVKVYDAATGAFKFSFGDYGRYPGQMIFPAGIAVDDDNQEVYVVDQTNGRVQVFTLEGAFKKSFGAFGSGSGRLTRGQGIAVSGGNVYVTDSYQSFIEVFDRSGVFVGFIGSFGDGPGNLKIPSDVVKSGSRLFVTNTDNSRVEVFDIVDQQGLNIAPSSLSFTTDMNVNPPAQPVQVDALVPGSLTPWTATASAPFVISMSQSSGTTPATVGISVDVTDLPAGAYAGGVTFRAQNGLEYPLLISVTVRQSQPQLLVSPGSIDMAYKDGILTSQTISVGTSGKSVAWTAATDAQWLTLATSSGSSSGTTPDNVTVSLNESVNTLSDGVYNAAVTISAPDALGGPITVPVLLTVERQKLTVSPASITMAYKDGILTSQTISVASNSNLHWTASTDAAWLTLSASSGATPLDVTASLNGNVNTLADGSYTATITMSATEPNVVGSPVAVPVTLTVIRQKLTVSPASITMAYKDGILSSQTISVASNSNLHWTAAADAAWLTLSSSSGLTPSDVTASLNENVNTLADGSYNTTITVSASEPDVVGSPVAIPVTLSVVRQRVLVSPASLDMFHQKEGELEIKSLSIESSGGVLAWTAEADAQWLTLSAASGSAPSDITVSLNQNADSLPEGEYSATVSIIAPKAVNSPATLTVTLRVVEAGTVIIATNLEAASYTISGPVSYEGSGQYWRNDEVKPGAYTVQFNYVKGFRVPAARTFELKTGKAVAIEAQYRPLPVANAIAVAKGPDLKNDALVRVLELNGSLINEFMALSTKYGANIAMGDIDGDGTGEVVVAPGKGPQNQALLKVFSYDGSLITSLEPIAGTVYGAGVAVADIDGDGRDELAMSFLNVDKKTHTVILYSADASFRLIERARVSFAGSAEVTAPAALAFGDLNGDGRLELIVSRMTAGNASEVTIFAIDENMDASPMASRAYSSLTTISAGDLDGDGIDEVALGYESGFDSVVDSLHGDLTGSGIAPLTAFTKSKSAPTLSMMDTDGDSVSEVLTGLGDQPTNDAIIRIYGIDDMKEIKAFEGSKYGVNAAFGVIKR